MDAAAELGRNPVSKYQIPSEYGYEQENIHFSCSTDHEQDWQLYSVDPYSCYMSDHIYIHIGDTRGFTYTADNCFGTCSVKPIKSFFHHRIYHFWLQIATTHFGLHLLLLVSKC